MLQLSNTGVQLSRELFRLLIWKSSGNSLNPVSGASGRI